MNCDYNSNYYQNYGECPPAQRHLALLFGSTTPWWHYLLLALLVLVALSSVFSFLRIIQQYERGVIFRFGQVIGEERQPGIVFKLPLADRLVKVNVQVTPLPLQAQQVITKDSVSLTILAVAFYKVVDAIKSEVEVDDYEEAIEEYGQSVMRKLIGRHTLEEILHSNADIAEKIKAELEHTVSAWGIEITKIELKDIDLPEGMRRAMAAKAEAQREADAKVVGAQGELDSAKLLREASNELDDRSMRLRELSVLREIADERSTIIVFPTGSIDAAATAAAAAGTTAANQQK